MHLCANAYEHESLRIGQREPLAGGVQHASDIAARRASRRALGTRSILGAPPATAAQKSCMRTPSDAATSGSILDAATNQGISVTRRREGQVSVQQQMMGGGVPAIALRETEKVVSFHLGEFRISNVICGKAFDLNSINLESSRSSGHFQLLYFTCSKRLSIFDPIVQMFRTALTRASSILRMPHTGRDSLPQQAMRSGREEESLHLHHGSAQFYFLICKDKSNFIELQIIPNKFVLRRYVLKDVTLQAQLSLWRNDDGKHASGAVQSNVGLSFSSATGKTCQSFHGYVDSQHC
eukprot:IDg6547t1